MTTQPGDGDRIDLNKGSQAPMNPGQPSPYGQPGSSPPPAGPFGQTQYGSQQPTYGAQQPAYGGGQQPAYGGYQGGPPAQGPTEGTARTLAIACHLSGLVTALTAYLGWLVPLVLYLMYKDKDPMIRFHAAQSLNFQITVFIGMVISTVLFLVLIGFVTFGIIWLCSVIFPILGAVKASDGEPYHYPLTPQIVK